MSRIGVSVSETGAGDLSMRKGGLSARQGIKCGTGV